MIQCLKFEHELAFSSAESRAGSSVVAVCVVVASVSAGSSVASSDVEHHSTSLFAAVSIQDTAPRNILPIFCSATLTPTPDIQ